MAEDAQQTRRPLLVASMIVRDEEDLLDECLSSLDGLVDRIEVLDTGSVDRTVEIAGAHGANVSHADWRDDFGRARNQSLDNCRDARFALIIDADERISCPHPAAVRALLGSLPHGHLAIQIEVRNLDEGRLVAIHRNRRIITTAESRWSGAVHEQVGLPDGAAELNIEAEIIALDHVGASTAIREAKDKSGRNFRIAQARLEHDTSPEATFEYLRTMASCGEEPATIEAEFARVLNDPPEFHPRHGSTILGYWAALLFLLERWDETLAKARAATELLPANHQAASIEATVLSRQGRFQEVVDRFLDLEDRPSLKPFFDEVSARDSWLRSVARAAAETGDGRVCLAVVADPRFPAATNPWPLLLDPRYGIDRRAAARVAAARSDGRFLVALSEWDSSPEQAVLAAWVDGQGEPEMVASVFATKPPMSLPPEPGLIDAAAGLDAESVLGLAKQVAHGHIDLELELETLPRATPIEGFLEVAMVGLDRLPHTGAVQLARVLDPRRPRVAAVLARELLAGGRATQATAVIEAADTGVAGPLTTSLLVDLAVLGNLDGRGFDPAVELAAEVMGQGVAIGVWPDLVAAAGTDLNRVTVLVALAGTGNSDPLLDAIENLHPAHQIEYCAGLLAAGIEQPRAVLMGLVAAGAARIEEAGKALARWAYLLEPEVAGLLAEALGRDLPDTAAALRTVADQGD